MSNDYFQGRPKFTVLPLFAGRQDTAEEAIKVVQDIHGYGNFKPRIFLVHNNITGENEIWKDSGEELKKVDYYQFQDGRWYPNHVEIGEHPTNWSPYP